MRTTERPAVCLPVSPRGQSGSSASLRTLRHKTVTNGAVADISVHMSDSVYLNVCSPFVHE